MVIILDSFGARDKLVADLPEATETRASSNFVDRTNGMSDNFWCIFNHAEFHAGYVEVQLGRDN